MSWILAIVALSLTLTILTIAELRQTAKVIRLPDRLFVVVTFTVAIIYGLVVLGAKILL